MEKVMFKNNSQLQNQSMLNKNFRQFKFEEGKNDLNMTLIENVDLERIYYKGEIFSAQSALRNIVDSKIKIEDIENMNFEQYSKILRLSQLAMEYYSQMQIIKQKEAEKLYDDYTKSKQKQSKLFSIKEQHGKKNEELSQILKKAKSKIDELKQQSLKQGQYKCLYCSNKYTDKESLKSHQARRHPEILKDLQEQNKLIEESNPINNQIIKIKQLESEKQQQLQEKLQQKINQIEQQQQIQFDDKGLGQEIASKISEKVKEKFDELSKVTLNSHEVQMKQNLESQKQELNEQIGNIYKLLENLEKNQGERSKKDELLSQYQEKINVGYKEVEANQLEVQKKLTEQIDLQKQQYELTKQSNQLIKTYDLQQINLQQLKQTVNSEQILEIKENIENIQIKSEEEVGSVEEKFQDQKDNSQINTKKTSQMQQIIYNSELDHIGDLADDSSEDEGQHKKQNQNQQQLQQQNSFENEVQSSDQQQFPQEKLNSVMHHLEENLLEEQVVSQSKLLQQQKNPSLSQNSSQSNQQIQSNDLPNDNKSIQQKINQQLSLVKDNEIFGESLDSNLLDQEVQ